MVSGVRDPPFVLPDRTGWEQTGQSAKASFCDSLARRRPSSDGFST